MVEVTGFFRVMGQHFLPDVAEQVGGTSFSRKSNPGSLGTTGPHRGRPLPYGSAELECPLDLLVVDEGFFVAVERLNQACLNAGGTSRLLHLDVVFTEQCNIEMSPEFIGALSRLALTVTMSCFGTPETP